MIWRKQIAAGGSYSGGADGVTGEVIDFNGSKRGITLQSERTGDLYAVGLQEPRDGMVGNPIRWFNNSGYVAGRLFIDYPGSGCYSPPFHGIGDLPGSDAVPAQSGGRLFEIAGYPSEYEDSFSLDWGDAVFGGSSLYDMMIADLKKASPKIMVGGSISTRFNLVADGWSYWRIVIQLDFPMVVRDDPWFDDVAYIDGLFDYYKVPEALERLDCQFQAMYSLAMLRKGAFYGAQTSIARRGFGFGVAGNDQYFNPGVSGFANLGKPSAELFVLPDGRVTIASNSKAAYPTFGYVNSAAWPILRHDISSDAGKIDEMNPYDISAGKKAHYWRYPGYSTGGFNHGSIL